ncbi:bifunctional cystathionine gamma-lyase/homocysteine desulfhydrase [Alkalihalobacillus sp. LMS6]|uniref:bifunctional cystathionine gamma-lyase/homocysteine desulfhydrase n=1 Tax=Alkalihalobacillus sp. LMS6 TaxID=2924034 RepID=UPI0020D14252|nr:bifunctional cystathionine gamma-lyase/homocysteine desulfhydrase [Alkalihalobacillus sp. LMS6]UTR08126.1 bifunctional cystathionine gamma-lyase/homocysteine desulfhydrase [Alkalihalobacillus sp. LMS6]
MRQKTKLIHGGKGIDHATGAVNQPIQLSSTFKQDQIGLFKYEYGRTGNPTREAVEKLLADIEEGEYGFAFASGMAAITAVMKLLSPGDHIIITDDVYGGTYRFFTRFLEKEKISISFVDTSDILAVEEAILPETKALFVETPTNPLLKVTDLSRIGQVANEHQLLFIIDNTFATPYFQNPLRYGADVVIHSATKYLGGHSDVIAGAVIVKDDQLAAQLAYIQNATGAILGPHDSYLLMRGIKTLAVRMEEIETNTRQLVKFLQSHPNVKDVYYPGLLHHPGHATHALQSRGFGGIVSFTTISDELALQTVERTHYFTLAESLGAVESLISIPAKMTHASIPKERREALGIKDSLIRLSIGLEDVEDLAEDLEIALST